MIKFSGKEILVDIPICVISTGSEELRHGVGGGLVSIVGPAVGPDVGPAVGSDGSSGPQGGVQ